MVAAILALSVSSVVVAGPFEDGEAAWNRGDYAKSPTVLAAVS